ncbi:MAG: hypothetical protein KDN19_00725 [Verrucomicrobiae bacterium]|nr:hypothetical protein [Verrucomicrobiae bacterium]
MNRRLFLKRILAASVASTAAPLSSFADGQPFCDILGRFVEGWYRKTPAEPTAPPVVLPKEYPEIIDTLYSLAERYPQATRHWHSHAVDWPPPLKDDILVLVGRENLIELGVRPAEHGHEIVTRAGRKTDEWTVTEGDLAPFIVTLSLASILYSSNSAGMYGDETPPSIFRDARRIWTGGRDKLWKHVWRNEETFYSHPDGYLLASVFYEFEMSDGKVVPCYSYKAACHSNEQLQKLINAGWKKNSLGSD